MAAVSTRNIVKKFGDVAAVNGISLEVPNCEFMVLLGPSGCGKTTFLRIICGARAANQRRPFDRRRSRQ
jgi:multiple sugar transport system ATP-binding protein